MDLALNNGQLFYKGRLQKLNLGIADGKIKTISKKTVSAKKQIDCRGKAVLPGCIDVHVHMRDFNEKHKGTWLSESKAALHGGITTVFDMPNNKDFTTINKKNLLKKTRHAKKNSLVNFGIWFGIHRNNIKKLNSVKKSCVGYKLYMCKTTGDLMVDAPKTQGKAFKAVARTGKVLIAHPEDEEIIRFFTRFYKYFEKPIAHAYSRPNIAEAEAAKDALGMAKKFKTRLQLTHISARETAKLVRKAKKRSRRISCDTALHYLFMDDSYLNKKKGFAKMNCPLRSKKDVKAMWNAIRNGTADYITTDHAPHTIKEKKQGIWKVPAGVPGLDFYLPLLLDAASKGKISLRKIVQLCCENPAKLFCLDKGAIKKGLDADLVVVDMRKKQKVTRGKLFTKAGWSPYEGMMLKGAVEATIVNGNLVFGEGRFNTRFKGKVVLSK